ncbi:hypothetical protein C7N43_09115 [Sphingobacteriales bacterium UPWRP_1]|nr:hypothetical protein B6N25_08780 [Sphingobacteriales bacterium TSM_CSS]PSJ77384.1 hypothetical protein C7N43_09115 [Sphingobacteriales bacterium UPWRP_1]
MKYIYSICILTLIWASCKKEKNDTELINPNDPNAISSVLILPSGSNREDGTPPPPSSQSSAPDVTSSISDITSSNGATAPLLFNYSGVNGNLGGCFLQVTGADDYFNIPYTGSSSSSGQLQVPIGIPSNVDSGEFCISFCVYDIQNRISNVYNVCINVLRLGTGALQISLSWNTPTDQDLHVTDPSGTEIYYSNSWSATGGELDRDDIDGYGPENIYWLDNAPDGTYYVQVKDFENTSTPNNYYVSINSPGKSKTFNGTTINGNKVNVATIIKNGDTYTY